MFENIDGLAEREFDKAMRRERLKDWAVLLPSIVIAAILLLTTLN